MIHQRTSPIFKIKEKRHKNDNDNKSTLRNNISYDNIFSCKKRNRIYRMRVIYQYKNIFTNTITLYVKFKN